MLEATKSLAWALNNTKFTYYELICLVGVVRVHEEVSQDRRAETRGSLVGLLLKDALV